MLSALPALTSQPFPSVLSSAAHPKGGRRSAPLSFVAARQNSSPSRLGFRSLGGRTVFSRPRCTDWDGGESDLALESEILEFMRRSDKPDSFPSRRELVDGGRMDLVDAVLKKSGWLSFGWDLNEDDNENDNEEEDHMYGSFEETNYWSSREEEEEESRSSSVDSFRVYDAGHLNSASSSGRSLESETVENESGIEGILSRLEKERNITFGFGASDIEDRAFSGTKGDRDRRSKFSSVATVNGLFKSSKSSSLSPKKVVFDESGLRLNQNNPRLKVDSQRDAPKPDTWRAWSIQRAGVSDIKSEDTVVASSETSMGLSMDSGRDVVQITEIVDDPGERDKLGLNHEEISHSHIRNRLHHLELELSTVLRVVRSNADEMTLQKDMESSNKEIQTLTDAWELQQTEIMNSQDKLRSTRAKIAVLEGKMALALIDAQKVMEQKQKRIDDDRRALQLLRSACIVWPNSASEVLLAGTFDGWENKRKLKKSKTGVFSLWLQLYPGKYEIKFIVDGEWKTDPLRPIINNNGHENNLLIIT